MKLDIKPGDMCKLVTMARRRRLRPRTALWARADVPADPDNIGKWKPIPSEALSLCIARDDQAHFIMFHEGTFMRCFYGDMERVEDDE